MRRQALKTHEINGEAVRFYIDRLTVQELDAVVMIGPERGAKPKINADVLTRQQAAVVDQYMRVFPGDLIVDDVQADRVGPVFGGQSHLMAELFNLLLSCQVPTAQEQEDLTVAIRFTQWLSDPERKGSHWKTTGTSCAKCHELGLCNKRACGTTLSKKPVWNDSKIHVVRCPILSLTQEVERVMRLFDWTHTWTGESFNQHCLPGTPDLQGQEAWTLSAVTLARNVFTQVYAEALKKQHGRS